MKHLFRRTDSEEKQKDLQKDRNDPEAEKRNDDETEEPVGAGCCGFPRRSSHKGSYTLKTPSSSHHRSRLLKRCTFNTEKTISDKFLDDFLGDDTICCNIDVLRKQDLLHDAKGCSELIQTDPDSSSWGGPYASISAQPQPEDVNVLIREPLRELGLLSMHSDLEESPECSDEENLEEEAAGSFLWGAECSPAADNVDGAAASPVRAEYVSATNTLPPSSHLQVSSSCCLTRSHSAPSLSKIPKSNFRRAASLPDMKLKEFTPAISADETYSFQCSCPGLYQCSVSGLVFSMKGEGGVAYRTVPWNRRLLAQHHKKPAGPLFDIKCLQQSVCQLHLPHCEIISTGGGRSLQVAHVIDEGIEFIGPHQVTETHVVVNISGFSAYGNVKDEDSPPDPVRALVLLFYKPPEDPDLRSVLSVLLLPRNIVFHKIQRDRRKLDKNERYLETSPHCCLHPEQVYALSTSPEDDLIKVQPKEAEFDDEYHESFFPSFQVVLKRVLTDVNLTLRDSSSSSCVWEREVCLLPSGVKTLDTGPKRRPSSDLRSCFIRRISGPVLSSLLDQLLEKRVITDAEREAADTKQSRSDRARFVFDTVSNKGEAASSEMMEFLCEEDPFLCEHLGLKQNGEKAS